VTHPAGATYSDIGRPWVLAALIAGALFAGSSTLFVRLNELGPVASAFYRAFLALPPLWFAMRWETRPAARGAGPLTRRDHALLILAGVFFAGDLFFWHLAIMNTAVANATLLATLSPVYVTAILFLLFGERVRPLFLGGTALAVAGAAMLMGDSFAFRPDRLLGDAYGLITGLFLAGYMVTVGRLRRAARIGTGTLMFWSTLATAVVLLPLAVVLEDRMLAASVFGWGMLLALALVSHVAGQGLVAMAMAHLPTAFAAVGLIMEVVAAAALGWLFLNEPLAPLQWIGAVVVVAGVVVARRGSREPRHSAALP
jgi:drug/metabolite transporter (DMT)-like permease